MAMRWLETRSRSGSCNQGSVAWNIKAQSAADVRILQQRGSNILLALGTRGADVARNKASLHAIQDIATAQDSGPRDTSEIFAPDSLEGVATPLLVKDEKSGLSS